MKTIDSSTLRNEMNRLGASSHPFLWAASYDLEKCLVIPDSDSCDGILWHIGRQGNHNGLFPSEAVPELKVKYAVSREQYAGMFSTVMAGLRRGDSFLANLTCATEVESNVSLRDIFLRSSAPFRLLIDDDFVCFSPEPFVRIEGRRISTFPMKGTADASLPDAELRLLSDYKETCEHHTIVDLMRNDINSVATDVSVDDFRYVEKIATSRGEILQTSSAISGTIPEKSERMFGDLILPLLPAGSITGAPKQATVRLIRKAEPVERGWYTGVFGYFDGKTMQTAVMIRCLQRDAKGNLFFHSGGGVTVNSNPDEEYNEMIEKVYLTR